MGSNWKRKRRIAATALFLALPTTSAMLLAAIAVGISRGGAATETPTTRPAAVADAAGAR